MMAVGKATGDTWFIDQVYEVGKRENWKVISTAWKGNDHCTPQAWLEMYEIKRDAAMLKPTQKALDKVIEIVATQDNNLEFVGKNQFKWSWCDALFMSPPTYARLGKITGDEKYLDFLHQWWWTCSDFYYDQDAHLYYRDHFWFNRREPNGQKVFWSRGNGWVVGGLVRVLQYLSMDDPIRPRYEQQLREMCLKLAEIQGDDGLWRSSLLYAEGHPQAETSGSAFFIYGLAYAVNEKIIDRERFEPVIQKGWQSLATYVQADGKFTGVQPVGDKPVHYNRDNTMPYGTGALLLAASEMYRLENATNNKELSDCLQANDQYDTIKRAYSNANGKLTER